MHRLDAVILRNALKSLESAMADLKAGGPVAETMAALSIAWAKTDIECVLATQIEETE